MPIEDKPLQCPACERSLTTNAKNGELVVCPFCNAQCELHDDTSCDMATGEEVPIRFLELTAR